MSTPTNVVVQKYNYWMRISIIVKICVKEALLEILHDPVTGVTRHPQNLYVLLANFKANQEKNLKNVIKPFQWNLMCHTCSATCPSVCPRHGQTDSENFDITCIVILIIHKTNLPSPTGAKGWKQVAPQLGDASKAAHVLLARQLRNDLMHCSLSEISTRKHLTDYLKRIEGILKGLGYTKMALFVALQTASLEPYLNLQIDSLRDKYILLGDIKADQTDVQIMQKTVADLKKKVKENVNKAELQHHLDTLQLVKNDFEFRLDDLEKRLDIIDIKMDDIGTKGDFQSISMTKNKAARIYGKVQVPFSTQSSIFDKPIDRDDIIVDLSLITDGESAFAMGVSTSDIRMRTDLREKQKTLASKEVDYKDIIKSTNDYVIVSGVPGCGKTTLVETLLYQWGSNQLWNEVSGVKFDFVFIIYLRMLVRFKRDVDITAEKILSHFYPRHNFEEILCSKEVNSLLILEGFDELSGKESLLLNEEKYTNYTYAIFDLLDPNNQKIPVTRMVTSRPGSCSILFKKVWSLPLSQTRRLLEITGFSNANIDRYVQKHFSGESESQKIIDKLKDTPIVYDMMVIPFYCWGVCYLIKNDIPVEEFAQTFTSLYANLLALFIRNHGFKDPNMKLLNVLKDPRFKDIAIGLAKLAFQLEETEKINFTSEDLPEHIQIAELIRDSGMLIEIEGDDSSLTETYQFLHYTFHEFLVAVHMFNTDQPNIKSGKSQIRPMLAGLIGGSLQSSRIVQEMSKLLSSKNKISIGDIFQSRFKRCDNKQKGGIIVLNENELVSIVFEYQNPIDIPHIIDNRFVLEVRLSLGYSSYEKQCFAYLHKQSNKNMIKLGPMILEEFRDKTMDWIWDFLRCTTCKYVTFSHGVNQLLVVQFLRKIIEEGKFFTNICEHFGFTYEWEKVAEIYNLYTRACSSLETGGDTKRFLQVANLIGKCNNNNTNNGRDCRLAKLIYHFHGSLNVEEIVESLDVCQEVVITAEYSCQWVTNELHIHDTERCFEDDGLVQCTTLAVLRTIKGKKFKVLKTLRVGSHCWQGSSEHTYVTFQSSDGERENLLNDKGRKRRHTTT